MTSRTTVDWFDQKISAGMLERMMIPSSSWHQAPMEAENEALIASAEGIPTGLAEYNGIWYMIQSGQGPYIARRWNLDGTEIS